MTKVFLRQRWAGDASYPGGNGLIVSDDGDDSVDGDDDDGDGDDVESYWDNKAECGSLNLGLVQYTRSPLYKVQCDDDDY